jgi:uncharacterized protein YlxW (UPF0749 family)
VSDDERALGGYSHEADAPTLIPVPSLLRSLLSDHLDPGYAAAAERRKNGKRRNRASELTWQLCAGLAVAAVFATAAAQAESVAPATRNAQQALAARVRAADTAARDSTAQRDTLTGQVESERRGRLAGDERGRQLLAALDIAESAAAANAVTGPGLTVTVTEPAAATDLSDVSKQRVAGSRQIILDRDLQLTVNSLWVSGAEAVAVGGVRIGPNVTIRQAGGGMLVDNQPISSPYVILAIGPPHAMSDVFDNSPALQRLRLLETSYGVGVNVSEGEALVVPAGSVRDLNFAKKIGSP